jgi:hypothetical protein
MCFEGALKDVRVYRKSVCPEEIFLKGLREYAGEVFALSHAYMF